MPIICRKSQKEDLDDINLLYQCAFKESVPFTNRQEIVFRRILKEELLQLLVIEKNQYIVGYSLLALIPSLSYGGRSFAVIEHLVIDPLYRKQGLATMLLNHACSLARKAGCYKIISTSESVKPWVKNIMAKQGFKEDSGVFVSR